MTKTTSPKMNTYQEWVFNSISEFGAMSGATVLELGGTPNHQAIAQQLIDRGATEVIQINIRKDLPESQHGAIRYVPGDARKTNFAAETFDIAFSASVLEHLLDIDVVLAEMHRTLKPGGLLCLHGGAFWNCAWGHHVWVHVDDEHYAFNGNNPIPNWSHLYLDKSEMKQLLLGNGLPADHVEKIVAWVYESHEINRLTYDDFVEIFNRSEFNIVSLTPRNWKIPDESIIEKLTALHGHRISNYAIGEAVVVLRKKHNAPPLKNSIPASAEIQPHAPADNPSPQTSTIPATKMPTHAPPQTSAENPTSTTTISAKNKCYQSLEKIHNDRFENTLEHLCTVLVNEGDVVVDVGAHAGRHTFPMTQQVGPSGTVYAFEPLPHLFNALETEIKNRGWGEIIELFPYALSKQAGVANFLHVEDAPGLSGLKERTSHQGHQVNSLEVTVKCLDDIVPTKQDVRFIKVDAEGADFHILQGASRILEQNRPLVVFESGRINAFPAKSYGYNQQEFKAFFAKLDYVLYDIAGLRYQDEFWNLPTLNDFVAMPREKETEYREFLQIAILMEFANQ